MAALAPGNGGLLQISADAGQCGPGRLAARFPREFG